MNYTLNQLRIFLKVTEKESITKASEELHLTQPAVSIQIKNFQNQFDIPLLENVGRKIHITDFGRTIAKSCRTIMNEIEFVEAQKLSYLGHLVGKLKISVVSTGKYVIPFFLSGFTKEFPGIQLNMDVTNKDKVIQSMEDNEVDFSLVSVIPKGMAINKVTLMQNKLFFVGKKNEEKNSRIKKPPHLSNVKLIYRERGSATRLAMENYMKSNNVESTNSMELTSNEAVKQALLAGLGYSVMPLIGLRNEIKNEELEIINLKGLPIVTDWHLIWLKNKSLSPASNAYLEFIEKNKKQVMEEHFSWYEKF